MAARRRRATGLPRFYGPRQFLAVTSWGAQVDDDSSRRIHEWADSVLRIAHEGSWVIFLHRGAGASAFFTRPYSAIIRHPGSRGPSIAPLEGRSEFVPGQGRVRVPLSNRAVAALRLSEEAARLDAQGAEAREVISDLLREEGYDVLAAELDEVSGRTGTTPFALNPRSFLHLRRHARARELVEHLPGLYAAVRYALSRMA